MELYRLRNDVCMWNVITFDACFLLEFRPSLMIVRFVQTNFMNVSLQEMALKKLLTKKARKDAAGDGSSAAPQVDMEFDGHRFRSEDHQRRFEAIKGWSFIRERRVQLREVEYVEFKEEIDKRQ